ncbi:MAG: hypothetical protein WBO95_10315 [Candidatus Dechloromonas phosphoritropha]
MDELLLPNFEPIEDAAVDDSISIFSGRGRWQIWRRREKGINQRFLMTGQGERKSITEQRT